MSSALLLAAAQPPWAADVVAWLALIPLLWALDGKRAWRRIALGLCCGTLWSCAVVAPWLDPALGAALPVGRPGAALLTLAAAELYGGLYLVLFAWLCRPVKARAWYGVLAAAALWVAVELGRAHLRGAVPWTLLGHSQWRRPLLIQIADAGGVGAVSFVIAAVNAGLFAALRGLAERRPLRHVVEPCLVVLVMLALTVAYGTWRLAQPPADGGETSLQIVHTAWQKRGEDDAAELLRHMVDLTARTPADGASLIVWPEASLRFYVQQGGEGASAVRDLVRSRKQFLLAGGPRFVPTFAGIEYFNSALLFAPDGSLAGASDKRLRVPLAEKPLGNLPSVARPFARGAMWTPLRAGDEQLGVLICFEAIFAGPARRLVGRGASLLVNVTNDQLVGAGAAQQAAMATFRAVENHVPLVRVSNLGPTLVVDRFGRIVTEAAGEGSFTAKLSTTSTVPSTFYGRHGDLFALLCLIPAAWISLAPARTAN